MIDRRTFVDGIAALGLLQAFAVHAQQQGKRFRIGVLGVGTPQGTVAVTQAFEQAMRELGYVDGGNVSFEYRWALGVLDRLPALAAELVQLPVDVILVGTNPAIVAAKQATSTTPIVTVLAVDPVTRGFIQSFARPGGNLVSGEQRRSCSERTDPGARLRFDSRGHSSRLAMGERRHSSN